MKLLSKMTFATLIISVSLSPVLVLAHGKAGHFHHRLERQQQRIENGVNSGVLTRKEAKQLRREQRKIRRIARKFREDGVLTNWERRKIQKKLNNASDHIWELKHNDRDRRENRYFENTYDRWNDNYENRWNWSDNDGYRLDYYPFR